jgi:predicted P-loop ATPase
VAAVSRVMKPGCKFDYMLITTGVQGLGKSTLPAKLGGKWYSDTLDTVSGKEAYEALQGVWIMEMGELKATKKADIEATKLFISKTEDAFRPAYGRRKQYFPRQTVFWGTSNDPQFLRDRTGNRRYWPVDVGVQDRERQPFDDLTQDVVDQIWAEAVVKYNAGEKLYLDRDEEKLALEQQELHTEESSLEGMILDYLDIPITDDWYTKTVLERRQYIGNAGDAKSDELAPSAAGKVKRMKVCVLEIWVELVGGEVKNLAPVKAAEIRNILNNIDGWSRHSSDKGRTRFGPGYGRQVTYERMLV